MKVPLLDLKAQYETIRPEVEAAVREVLESQWFILGPKVKELEEAICEVSGAPHGVGVSSGTDALLISLMAAGIGAGDEVITTCYSFFATAGCVSRVGAKPVFVDIEPGSLNLDTDQIEAAVSPRTRAIIPVHLFGQMAEMAKVMELAERHGLVVIEDAAQAIGCRLGEAGAGSIGHYGCFSFFPSKNLGAGGDGGLVVADDADRAERLRVLRGHGAKPKYFHEHIGGNFRLDAMQAAILLAKLPRLESWSEGRRRNAEIYRRLFREHGLTLEGEAVRDPSGRAGVVLPQALPGRTHIYNQFVIHVDRRDDLRAFLRERGIATEVYYPRPLHLQRCFADLGYQRGDFPVAERAAEQTLALPVYPELTEEQMRYVVSTIGDFCQASG